MLPRVRLGHSELEVAALGVGCWAWGDRRFWHYEEHYGGREVVDAFDACCAAGLDLFDTAEAYGAGKGERILGTLVRKSGYPAVVATKYAPIAQRGGAAALRKGVAGSLKRLGLPRVDLYQLHWPDWQEAPLPAMMNAFADAVQAGEVRAVGISNCSVAEMREAHAALARRGIPLATNQVHYSLLHRAPEVDGVLDACRDLGVTLLAYSPLEQGVLAGTYCDGQRPRDLRAESASFSRANIDAAQSVVAALREIAAAHAVEPGAIALAWLMAQPGVVPLAGAKNGRQAASNAKALAVVLSADEIRRLELASAAWRKA